MYHEAGQWPLSAVADFVRQLRGRYLRTWSLIGRPSSPRSSLVLGFSLNAPDGDTHIGSGSLKWCSHYSTGADRDVARHRYGIDYDSAGADENTIADACPARDTSPHCDMGALSNNAFVLYDCARVDNATRAYSRQWSNMSVMADKTAGIHLSTAADCGVGRYHACQPQS